MRIVAGLEGPMPGDILTDDARIDDLAPRTATWPWVPCRMDAIGT